MRPTAYLVDNSAYSRSRKLVVAEKLSPLIERGLLHTCAPVELEAGRAISANSYERLMELRRNSLVLVHMPDHAWLRALEVQRAMAGTSTHHGPGVVDLAIAVCAEHHGLTVLHYDADFDVIQAAIGVPTEWVAAPGSADGPDQF